MPLLNYNFLSVFVDALVKLPQLFSSIIHSSLKLLLQCVCVCVPFVFSLNELLQSPDYCASINGKQISPCMDSHTTSVGFIGDWISLSAAGDDIHEGPCQSIGMEAAVKAGERIRCHTPPS